MKRFLVVLLVCVCFYAPARAAASYFKFSSPVYPGLHGRDIGIEYERNRPGPDGILVLIDENGNELGAINVASSRNYGSICVSINENMPLGQSLQLVFRQQGTADELQDTCLLAADAAAHDGIRKVDTCEKKIAITFDTASGAGRTEKLLALLEKQGIHCTFFIEGEFCLNFPELVALIAADGHELANHSMHHPDMREIEDNQIYNEITKCNQAIEKITGKPVTLYRPPSGYYTYRDRAISRALGSEMVLWTFDSRDGFASSTEEQIWKIMTEKSENGAIILMHVYGKHTLNILERYIPYMREQGYEFVTVTELMQAVPMAETENGSAS